jgi:hypothetical protein
LLRQQSANSDPEKVAGFNNAVSATPAGRDKTNAATRRLIINGFINEFSFTASDERAVRARIISRIALSFLRPLVAGLWRAAKKALVEATRVVLD